MHSSRQITYHDRLLLVVKYVLHAGNQRLCGYYRGYTCNGARACPMCPSGQRAGIGQASIAWDQLARQSSYGRARSISNFESERRFDD
jgi:hypothetical protein